MFKGVSCGVTGYHLWRTRGDRDAPDSAVVTKQVACNRWSWAVTVCSVHIIYTVCSHDTTSIHVISSTSATSRPYCLIVVRVVLWWPLYAGKSLASGVCDCHHITLYDNILLAVCSVIAHWIKKGICCCWRNISWHRQWQHQYTDPISSSGLR